MKIRMNEHFQGTNQPTLTINAEYLVGADISKSLADWLLENNKAIVVEEEVAYGAKPLTDNPELAHDNITDAAFKFANENNIDWLKVKGTGSGGRIVMSDVQAYLEQEQTDEAD